MISHHLAFFQFQSLTPGVIRISSWTGLRPSGLRLGPGTELGGRPVRVLGDQVVVTDLVHAVITGFD